MPSRKLSKPEQISLRFDANEGLVAGVDEAGRGPLAGPVVAAAVILDDMRRIKGLNDSKQLTALQRDRLFDEIRAHALAFCVAEASVAEIDELNILHATMLAMKRAVEGLRLPPHQVLVDGNRLPKIRIRADIVKPFALVAVLFAGVSLLAIALRRRLTPAQFKLRYA